jgi:CheY-like chemotaxis protein
MRVLVVDDNPDSQDAMERYLKLCGCWTDHAGNGYGALTRMVISVPDAIVADQVMPGMDGVRLIQEMRSREKLKTVPVALTSGLPPPDAIPINTLIESLGPARYFQKPVNPADIVQWLKEVTGKLKGAPMPDGGF